MYRRFGELQYLVVPSDESDFSVELVGETEGSFTLEIEQYRGSEVTKRQSFRAIPSSLGTRVSLFVGNPDSVLDDEIKLAVDYDGNGSVDAEYNERGLIEGDFESDTYSDLKQLIMSWSLPPARSKVLLVLVEVAEKLGSKASLRPQLKTAERAALRVLEAKLRQYRGWSWITESQFEEIVVIINKLMK